MVFHVKERNPTGRELKQALYFLPVHFSFYLESPEVLAFANYLADKLDPDYPITADDFHDQVEESMVKLMENYFYKGHQEKPTLLKLGSNYRARSHVRKALSRLVEPVPFQDFKDQIRQGPDLERMAQKYHTYSQWMNHQALLEGFNPYPEHLGPNPQKINLILTARYEEERLHYLEDILRKKRGEDRQRLKRMIIGVAREVNRFYVKAGELLDAARICDQYLGEPEEDLGEDQVDETLILRCQQEQLIKKFLAESPIEKP